MKTQWLLYYSHPEQLVSVPEQLITLSEYLDVFRNSYESSGTYISLPEQLQVFQSSQLVPRSSYESAPEQLRKCSGAVTKVFCSS